VKPVLVDSESENAYQTFCKDLELILGFEVLLFEDSYEINQLCSRTTRFPDPLLKLSTL